MPLAADSIKSTPQMYNKIYVPGLDMCKSMKWILGLHNVNDILKVHANDANVSYEMRLFYL